MVSRLAMIAILSLPVWPPGARSSVERPTKSACSGWPSAWKRSLVLAVLVFLKQYLLDRERILLLRQSQDEPGESEAAAGATDSVGKAGRTGATRFRRSPRDQQSADVDPRICGIARSDDSANDTAREHAHKIKQQTRRTKELVTNLLRFARQSGTEKTSVNLNAIIGNTLQLHALEQRGTAQVTIERDLQERSSLRLGGRIGVDGSLLPVAGQCT